VSKSAADLIRGGRLRTDTYDVCLDPDLVEQHAGLVAERDAALEAKRDSLAGGATVELDAQIDALLEQMREATLTLTFSALPRPEFRAMSDRHPPRKDAEGNVRREDALLGVDYDAFFDDLIRASLTAPELSPDDLKVLLEERLTDRQYQDLTDVVWNLNRGKVDLPFSSAASRKTPGSAGR
jgi:hypothetical protein